jgi:hypothetical protein
MNHIRYTVTSCLLAAVAAPCLRADDPVVRLTIGGQTLQVQAGMRGNVFLVLGAPLVPPIHIAGIDLDVMPQHLLPLGAFEVTDAMKLFVPLQLRHLSAEAVLLDEELTLHDSNVVPLADAFDLITGSFRAELISTDSIPPYYSVAASLTAPTTGYDLKVDGFDLSEKTMNVYLRLIEPAKGEVVMPMLTPHGQGVALGTDVGTLVRVYMMRIQRDDHGPEVYRLMAELPVPVKG